MLVLAVLVAIVPVNPWKLYVRVWANVELALLIFIVVALPMFPSAQVTELVLGIVGNFIVLLMLPLGNNYSIFHRKKML